MENWEIDHSSYVEIAEGIFWVGYSDEDAGFHCNPYLIVDHEEAVLIDSGSRNDFSTVMLKIMRTGTNPKNITRLIYQHYDPDLCGNIPHMEAMAGSKDLRIISHNENNIFIDYYSPKSPKDCIEKMGFKFEFSSGRRLEFVRTPYSHAPGSFVTYDTKTKALFSGDLFGGYDANWSLYSKIHQKCEICTPENICPLTETSCEIVGLESFHRQVMTSTKALRYALSLIEKMDVSVIAPQHGSIFHTPLSQKIAIGRLKALSGVGIDSYL